MKRIGWAAFAAIGLAGSVQAATIVQTQNVLQENIPGGAGAGGTAFSNSDLNNFVGIDFTANQIEGFWNKGVTDINDLNAVKIEVSVKANITACVGGNVDPSGVLRDTSLNNIVNLSSTTNPRSGTRVLNDRNERPGAFNTSVGALGT